MQFLPSYLDWEYERGQTITGALNGNAPKDGTNGELLQVFAVAAKTKPAAWIPWSRDDPYSLRDVQNFARKHGIRVLAHLAPHFAHDGSIEMSHDLFFSQQQAAAERYTQLVRQRETGTIAPADYHRALGELLGYAKADIDTFITNNADQPPFDNNVAKLKAAMRPAMYDELAKDPVMGSLFPPEQRPGGSRPSRPR